MSHPSEVFRFSRSLCWQKSSWADFSLDSHLLVLKLLFGSFPYLRLAYLTSSLSYHRSLSVSYLFCMCKNPTQISILMQKKKKKRHVWNLVTNKTRSVFTEQSVPGKDSIVREITGLQVRIHSSYEMDSIEIPETDINLCFENLGWGERIGFSSCQVVMNCLVVVAVTTFKERLLQCVWWNWETGEQND